MKLPFDKTVKQANERGFVRTVFMLLALSSSKKSVLPYLKHIPERAIVEVNKSKMLLFPRKGGINCIHFDLFLYKKREPNCTNYLMHSGVLKEGDVVLDIGANIGYYVLIESRLVGKTGKVYAVEPVRGNFELLEKNVQLNNLENVSTLQFAFGDEDAKSGTMYVSDKDNLCTMNINAAVSGKIGKIVSEEEVPVAKVDTFFKDKTPPNFIRMDVEGSEYGIIKGGMVKTLKRDIKILMELHPESPYIEPEKVNELFHILEENNFRVRFAVFEDKVEENEIAKFFLRKGGNKLPIIASNISLQEFKRLVENNSRLAYPSVIFEKQNAPD